MFRYCLAGVLACMPMMATAVIEDFSSALWQHHEELGTQVLTDDLVISVPAGSSIKGVREPNALQPGFDRFRPAEIIEIAPRNTQYLDVHAIGGTDLFQMAVPLVQVRGYRGGVEVASALLGPFWDEANKTGTIEALSGFTGIERLELRSDVAPEASSDVSFFLEAVSYTATDTYVKPPKPVIDDDDDGGAAFGLLLLIGLLARRTYAVARAAADLAADQQLGAQDTTPCFLRISSS